MEINGKHFLLMLLCVLIYLLVIDYIKTPDFKETIKNFIHKTANNETSHSIVDWIENKTNTLAGFIAISSAGILNYLPVIQIKRNFI